MGKAYTQVTMEERCEIARLRSQGSSLRQIAAGVDRPPSTVARELKRNGSRTLGYQPRYANQQAHARRWRGSRLERDGPLREQVLAGLGAGWSPAQVAGRLALDEGRRIISHESIYRFIYAQMARKKDYSWRHYLPRAKAKRGFRGRRGEESWRWPMGRRGAERPSQAQRLLKPGPTGHRRMACGQSPPEIALSQCGRPYASLLWPEPAGNSRPHSPRSFDLPYPPCFEPPDCPQTPPVSQISPQHTPLASLDGGFGCIPSVDSG